MIAGLGRGLRKLAAVVAGVGVGLRGGSVALVVHSAAAAASPRLRSIGYRLRAGRGLALHRGPAGSLGVLDAATGRLVFVVGQPLMWDSSRSRPIPARASADGAGSGRVTPVPVSYRLAGPAAATIGMRPPAAALTGSRVRYPVFIDPEIAPGTAYYVQLMRVSNGYTQAWNTNTGTTSQPSGQVEVGDCGYSGCLWKTPTGDALGYVDRDYFRFDTPDTSNAYLDLGPRTLTAGTHTLTFTITGQDASALGFQAGINYLTLSPTNRYEAENLPAGTPTAGTLAPQYQANSPWSGNGQLALANTTVGRSFTVTLSAPVESDYALGVNLTTDPSYGSLRFDLDPQAGGINLDNTASNPLDAYSPTVSATYVFLGGVHLTRVTHVLQVT